MLVFINVRHCVPLTNIYLLTIYMAVQIRDDVRDHPELYSQIYTPHPVVVPGGRFRELYYWLVSPFTTYIQTNLTLDL